MLGTCIARGIQLWIKRQIDQGSESPCVLNSNTPNIIASQSEQACEQHPTPVTTLAHLHWRRTHMWNEFTQAYLPSFSSLKQNKSFHRWTFLHRSQGHFAGINVFSSQQSKTPVQKVKMTTLILEMKKQTYRRLNDSIHIKEEAKKRTVTWKQDV